MKKSKEIIPKTIAEQLDGLLTAYESVAPMGHLPTKIPTKKRAAVQSFCQQLSVCHDAADASIRMQLQLDDAALFLSLAKFVVEIYVKYRNFSNLKLPEDTRCRFAGLAKLVNDYLIEIDRGARSPFCETKKQP